jgi:hypothetical protein
MHWSTRKLARELGIPHMLVARTWARADLRPHRLDRYMASSDPDFETKAVDIIGLYLKPPQHAAIFCADEKTAIWASRPRPPRELRFAPRERQRAGCFPALSLQPVINLQRELLDHSGDPRRSPIAGRLGRRTGAALMGS